MLRWVWSKQHKWIIKWLAHHCVTFCQYCFFFLRRSRSVCDMTVQCLNVQCVCARTHLLGMIPLKCKRWSPQPRFAPPAFTCSVDLSMSVWGRWSQAWSNTRWLMISTSTESICLLWLGLEIKRWLLGMSYIKLPYTFLTSLLSVVASPLCFVNLQCCNVGLSVSSYHTYFNQQTCLL